MNICSHKCMCVCVGGRPWYPGKRGKRGEDKQRVSLNVAMRGNVTQNEETNNLKFMTME